MRWPQAAKIVGELAALELWLKRRLIIVANSASTRYLFRGVARKGKELAFTLKHRLKNITVNPYDSGRRAAQLARR